MLMASIIGQLMNFETGPQTRLQLFDKFERRLLSQVIWFGERQQSSNCKMPKLARQF